MKQSDRTKRAGFRLSLLLHGGALALALAIPWACAVHRKPKLIEPISFLQIPITVRPASVPEPVIVEPPEPVFIPEPAKEPAPKPEPLKSEPAKKPKPIERQTNRVVKTTAAPDPPKQPVPPTEESIKAILTAEMPESGPIVLEVGESDPVLGAYYQQVYDRMYSAWIQPSHLKSLPGLSADIRIVVEPNGNIAGRTKTRSSGNELMDESAMKAVQSVKKLPSLPREFRSPREIVVTFEIGNGT